jgi:hypothetical protein
MLVRGNMRKLEGSFFISFFIEKQPPRKRKKAPIVRRLFFFGFFGFFGEKQISLLA